MPRLKTARKRAAKQEVVPSLARPVGELESGALSSSSDSDDSSVEGSRASLGLDDLEEGEEFQVSLQIKIEYQRSIFADLGKGAKRKT